MARKYYPRRNICFINEPVHIVDSISGTGRSVCCDKKNFTRTRMDRTAGRDVSDEQLQDETKQAPKQKRNTRSLKSCIAFEHGDDNIDCTHGPKPLASSPQMLSTTKTKECPTCSDSDSEVFRHDPKTRKNHQNSSIDMKLLMEAINNLERSESSSISSSKRNTKAARTTFTKEQQSRIERENRILLSKIIERHRPRMIVDPPRPVIHRSSSAINRKKQQTEIDRINQILLKKIQHAKPTLTTNRGFGRTYY
ncbi:cilia- and flagella-associated protein 97-like [Ischnura elegans]|uniref:cilia- and flagella-associated protein 97-like n=1 Tax=Ischnura elegans TaxID=197161 RepID=UPI001ED8B4D0|nr:cilia- and flagella-associated protein 97-like [Ischnura elegans]